MTAALTAVERSCVKNGAAGEKGRVTRAKCPIGVIHCGDAVDGLFKTHQAMVGPEAMRLGLSNGYRLTGDSPLAW